MSLRKHWRFIFGKAKRCSRLWLSVGHFLYVKCTPVFFFLDAFNGCPLVQLKRLIGSQVKECQIFI